MARMCDEDIINAIDGLMAYDTGCTDSGIHDVMLKQRVKNELHLRTELEKTPFPRVLSAYAVDLLTDERQEFSLLDIQELLRWLDDEMEIH